MKQDIIEACKMYKEMIGMANKSKRRFQVKRFLLETKDGAPVLRFMLTDNLLPMLTPNRFIEMKSVNKLGSGRNSAVKLSVFFNFLHEYEAIEYTHATNRHVQRFLDFLIYGDLNDLKITDPSQNLCFSTLQGYLTVITEFYKWLEQNEETKMKFHMQKGGRTAVHSYLFGQIYRYDYQYIIKRLLPRTKSSRSYIKWYTPSEIKSLCAHFLTLRDEAIFRLTLEGFRIDEVLSMRLSDYDSTKRLIQPSRSKMRQTAPINGENRLRKIRISDETGHVLDRYLYEERAAAENQSGIITEWIFLNLRKGKNFGMPVAYPNYLAVLKGCARRAGMDPSKIRTHSGRSTKVMELLENGALNPAERKSEAELLYHFGWKSINSMQPYMKLNSEIMANAAFDRHNKIGDGDD